MIVGNNQQPYWQDLLNNISQTALPTDFKPVPVSAFIRDEEFQPFDSKLVDDLAKFCAQEDITPSGVLIATLKILLFRFSEQRSISISSLFSDKTEHQLADDSSPSPNPVILNSKLGPDDSFNSVLQGVKQNIQKTKLQPAVPFEALAKHYQEQTGKSLYSLLRVACVVLAGDIKLSRSPITEDILEQFDDWISTTDLVLLISLEAQQPQLTCHYNGELFKAETIQRLMTMFLTLLNGVLKQPDQPISSLALLTKAEEEKILLLSKHAIDCQGIGLQGIDYQSIDKSSNQAIDNDVCPSSFLTLFLAQVEKNPQAIAVIFENQQLTYLELNQAANQLAHYLQSHYRQSDGATAGTLVAICLQRSTQILIALLAVLKSGAAYLPMDPSYPDERLAYIFSDSKARLLVTEQALDNHFVAESNKAYTNKDHPAINENPLNDKKQIIYIDTDAPQIKSQKQENPALEIAATNTAYVIYTSGSTGRPKGIEISHASLSNFLLSMKHKPGIKQRDSLLAITTISFDIAALELFLPLIAGCKVVIAKKEDTLSGAQLIMLLKKYQISIMQATPITWQLMLDNGLSEFNSLRVLCGGEALSARLAERLLEQAGEVWNLYGPTETTIWSSLYQLKSPLLSTKSDTVLIGKAIENTQIYILDKNHQPVPIGFSGEIYIGGHGLAKGYINRAELSRDKFQLLQLPTLGKQRLFRSGDLGRYDSDGNIEYLGRLDTQVKLRGFRIELGEIEAVLESYSKIKQVAIISQADDEGKQKLSAYIVSDSESITQDEVRRYSAKLLPEYMLPTSTYRLAAMPLTANGKLDRQALPAAAVLAWSKPSITLNLPKSGVESDIAEIWKQVLKLEEINTQDSFFQLGGHSLLLVQVHKELNQLYPEQLKLTDLYKYPSISTMADYLQQAGSRTRSHGFNTSPQADLNPGQKRGLKRRARILRKT